MARSRTWTTLLNASPRLVPSSSETKIDCTTRIVVTRTPVRRDASPFSTAVPSGATVSHGARSRQASPVLDLSKRADEELVAHAPARHLLLSLPSPAEVEPSAFLRQQGLLQLSSSEPMQCSEMMQHAKESCPSTAISTLDSETVEEHPDPVAGTTQAQGFARLDLAASRRASSRASSRASLQDSPQDSSRASPRVSPRIIRVSPHASPLLSYRLIRCESATPRTPWLVELPGTSELTVSASTPHLPRQTAAMPLPVNDMNVMSTSHRVVTRHAHSSTAPLAPSPWAMCAGWRTPVVALPQPHLQKQYRAITRARSPLSIRVRSVAGMALATPRAAVVQRGPPLKVALSSAC